MSLFSLQMWVRQLRVQGLGKVGERDGILKWHFGVREWDFQGGGGLVVGWGDGLGGSWSILGISISFSYRGDGRS